MFRIERRVLRQHRIEPDRGRRARLRDAFPALRRLRIGRGLDRPFRGARRQAHHIVVGRGAGGFARRIGIVGRPLAAGALAEHAAQPQEDEDCERKENDGVNVEQVPHAFYGRTGISGTAAALDAVLAALT